MSGKLNVRIALLGILISGLSANGRAYVVPAYDAVIWGIDNSKLTIEPNSIITKADLIIENLRPDSSCTDPVLFVQLLNNPRAELAQITDANPGNYFGEYGSPLQEISLADSLASGFLLPIHLNEIDRTDSWTKTCYSCPVSVGMPDFTLRSFSSALLEFLDNAGTGTSFGFGLDSDGFLYDRIIFIVTIESLSQSHLPQTRVFSYINRFAPQLYVPQTISVQPNETVTFPVATGDPDGNPVTCKLENSPPGASFTNARFTWTPSESQTGQWELVFSASDGAQTTQKTVLIRVAKANHPPIFPEINPIEIMEMERINLQIRVSDPEGDPIEIAVENLPDGAEYLNNCIEWRPFYGQAGEYKITVHASDGKLETIQTIALSVSPTKPPYWYISRNRQDGVFLF